MFISSPIFNEDKLLNSKVSFTAVNVYSSSFVFTTVKHTPLWEMLWSILNSLAKDEAQVICKFDPSYIKEITFAIFSIIPVNILIVYHLLF